MKTKCLPFYPLLLCLLCSFTALGQVQSGKRSSTKTTRTVSPRTTQTAAQRAAALVKAKQDSATAVQELARQMARQMFVEDSVKRAELAAEQENKKLASQPTTQQSQPVAKPAKKESTKPVREPAAKAMKAEKPQKERLKPQSASSDAHSWIGVRGMGLGSTYIGNDVPDGITPLIGYAGGVVANFGLGAHVSLQPEILYMQQGVKIAEVSIRYNVVHVPLLLKYSFGAYNRGFFINVGPYGNYLLSAQAGDSPSVKPTDTTIEYGVAGGFGVALPVGRGRLLAEVRGTYYLGTNQKATISGDVTLVTGGLSVGYLFPLGK